MKHGATVLSAGGLLASFVQMMGFAQHAGGIMFAANAVVMCAAALAWFAVKYGGNPEKIERIATHDMPGLCKCGGGTGVRRGMLIGRCRNCQGWREVK